MALSNINDIVVEYQDIVIVEGDIDYVSIYLTSGTDEGYRKLYELAGLNPDDYEEVKDDPEEIEEFYLQLFATGDMKVNDN
ncbi:hypothetical protein IKQ26_05895, partial [bacterium]|nr:hypothetical protein [bacterium]